MFILFRFSFILGIGIVLVHFGNLIIYTIMVLCGVVGCNSSNNKRRVVNSIDCENVQFFRVPRDTKYKHLWEACFGGDSLKTSHSYICSKHFKDEDYAGNFCCEHMEQRVNTFKILKEDAVPTINVPVPVGCPTDVFPVSLIVNPNASELKAPPEKAPSEKAPEKLTNACINNWNNEVQFTPQWIVNQMKFVDHVIMVWVNRGRAGDPKIVMLDTMLKAKAVEAAKILNLHIQFCNEWLRSFKEKLRKQDARHPPHRDPGNPSMNIVDIIIEEYEDFRINEPGSFCLGRLPCTCPDNHWNLETVFSDEWHAKQRQFLDHVIMIWVNWCRSGDPNIVMLDSMIKIKAQAVAEILKTKILLPNVWIAEFKEKLKIQDARNPPKRFNPDLSMNIMDIIEKEWSRFRPDDRDVLWEGYSINSEEHFDCDMESIDSYGQVLDCLMVVKSYASSVDNTEALSLIVELEDFLSNEK